MEEKQQIITPPVAIHIQLKRVKPTQNKCIRWLRKLRTRLLWEPLPVASDVSLDTLCIRIRFYSISKSFYKTFILL